VAALRQIRLWAGIEAHIQDSLYELVHSVDFSREVLSVQAKRLVALKLSQVDWSDLGHPERVMAVLQVPGLQPWWMKEWKSLIRSGADARTTALV